MVEGYSPDYFLDFVDNNPLSKREANAIYEFTKALSAEPGMFTAEDIMDIIVVYYE